MSIYRSSELAQLLDAERRGERRLAVSNAAGSLPALFIAAADQRSPKRNIILTADSASAAGFVDQFNYYRGESPAALFPCWDILPYDTIAPNPEISAERISALDRFCSRRINTLVVPARALLQPTAEPDLFINRVRVLRRGDLLDRDDLISLLIDLGYYRLPAASDYGDFAVRGGIVDLYPPGSSHPFRIEFADNEIESIRLFEPDSQVSFSSVDEIRLLPARELILDDDRRTEGLLRIEEIITPELRSRTLIAELGASLEDGTPFGGIESFSPVLSGGLISPLDYIGQGDRLVLIDPTRIAEKIAGLFDDISALEGERYRRYATAAAFGATIVDLDPRKLFGNFLQVFFTGPAADIESAKKIEINSRDHKGFAEMMKAGRHGDEPFRPLFEHLNNCRDIGYETHIVCRAIGSANWLAEALNDGEVEAGVEKTSGLLVDPPPPARRKTVRISVGRVGVGFHYSGAAVSLITEQEIFGERTAPRKKVRTKSQAGDGISLSIEGLIEGQALVHIDYGVGLYRGLERRSIAGFDHDFLNIEYADGILKLPVENLDLVQRYSGLESKNQPLDRLSNSAAWNTKKKKVKEAVLKLAAELLDIYASREAFKGHAFSDGGIMEEDFRAGFDYDETPDQQRAISDVLADMKSEKAMDRLICGDVGFGKTEVAMRAAFLAAIEGRQTAILAPTTVLAEQHHQTFSDRMAPFPVEVAALSRFRSKKEQDEIVSGLKEGKVDIVIGTHRLLSRDINFKNLGLLIIDEEQRFGVKHKERLKKMRRMVDVLTLTATPIPRTLHLAMVGVRDLSIIASPPENRLAIRTYIEKKTDDVIRSSIRRELSRQGQVFYVHNRISSIELEKLRLQRLVPEARITVGHAQMKPMELEKVMYDFYHGKYDILLSTTIIENGLDVPRANTIIIDRAENLGLGELYQLRGRVGRSDRRAYCYLLTPPEEKMGASARMRIEALAGLSELGAGFRLAAHDLEIRGAGDILGARQHGHIAAVGFDMYNQLLSEAINEIKGIEHKIVKQTEIKLAVKATIPEHYMIDPRDRLAFYKKISSATDRDGLWELEREVVDRFGKAPEEVENLLRLGQLRTEATELGLDAIEGSSGSIRFIFGEATSAPPEKIVALVSDPPAPGKVQMKGEMALRYYEYDSEKIDPIDAARKILQRLK